MKKVVSHHQCFEKFTDLRSANLDCFRNIKQYEAELESLMTLTFHTLGA